MYKAFSVPYSPRANKMASLVEDRANELEKDGYEVVSLSIMPSAHAVLLARTRDEFEGR